MSSKGNVYAEVFVEASHIFQSEKRDLIFCVRVS